jgi:peptidoglycan hydrolase CwlO-like protein
MNLTPEEIETEIKNLEKELEDVIMADIFVLNNKIANINDKITSLQEQCEHKYENGTCVHCHKVENK